MKIKLLLRSSLIKICTACQYFGKLHETEQVNLLKFDDLVRFVIELVGKVRIFTVEAVHFNYWFDVSVVVHSESVTITFE